MGCDGARLRRCTLHACFNPRTHMGCDLSFSKLLRTTIEFQSTHPHGVRLVVICLHNKIRVSIHAPTRGATHSTHLFGQFYKFQSTHPHGVRRFYTQHGSFYTISFNPRTHTGCDLAMIFAVKIETSGVSIHAPTRGATITALMVICVTIRFNPRTHTGCDFKHLIV